MGPVRREEYNSKRLKSRSWKHGLECLWRIHGKTTESMRRRDPFAENRDGDVYEEGQPPNVPLFSQFVGVHQAASHRLQEEDEEEEGIDWTSRSGTIKSTTSDRRIPKDGYEDDVEAPEDAKLALKIDVIAGPCSQSTYTSTEDVDTVNVGRSPENHLVLYDAEISGRHLVFAWCYNNGCWTVTDQGSLNGSYLNGDRISMGHKIIGEQYRLSADDMIQLGTSTKLKISLLPHEMVEYERNERRHSLSLESFPRSLTMPKHKIPSFSSLVSPKMNSSPTRNALVAASSDELRLQCCIVSCVGREHARRRQIIEDVASAECPLLGSEHGNEGIYSALFCVFDGHCGRSAAEAASSALPEELKSRLNDSREWKKSMHDATEELRETFLATDDRISDEAGCTATSIFMWRTLYLGDETVYIQSANVGDSCAILIHLDNGAYEMLTEDHRLSNPTERARLEQNGIPLTKDSRRLYGLNLARALGDRFLKDEDLGLSAEPFVSNVYPVDSTKSALVIVGSDGLWDFVTPADASRLAIKADDDNDGSVVEVAAALVREAQSCGSRDDITAMVVRIWPREEWDDMSPSTNPVD